MANFPARLGLLLSLFAAASIGGQQPTHATVVYLGQGKPIGACLAKLQTLDHELRSFPYPSEWTLEVACDPTVWTKAIRRADFPPTHTAFTGVKVRISVFNGAIFDQSPKFYRHTLAHELGHIRCNCGDESKAETIALAYLASAEYLATLKPSGTLAAK